MKADIKEAKIGLLTNEENESNLTFIEIFKSLIGKLLKPKYTDVMAGSF